MEGNVQTILTAISSVGFPIVMCMVLVWYIYKVQDGLTKAITELTQVVKELKVQLKGPTE